MSWPFEEDQRVPGIPQGLGSASPLPSSAPGTINTRENKAKPSKKVRGGTDRDQGRYRTQEAQPSFSEWSDFLGLLPLGFFYSGFSYLGVSKGSLPTVALGRLGQVVLG